MKIKSMRKSVRVTLTVFIVQLLLFLSAASGYTNLDIMLAGQASATTYTIADDNYYYIQEYTEYIGASKTPQTYKVAVVNSLEDASRYLRSQMRLRKDEINIKYNGSYYDDIRIDVYNKAFEYSDELKSDEGDYLNSEVSSCTMGAIYSSSYVVLKYNVGYLSTYDEQLQVNKEVKNVLDDLDVYGESDYTKVKAVHDYIVSNIQYYYGSEGKYSAYNAIVEKSVVCQGFASITYKMLRDLDVKVRMIKGLGKNQSHAWNIVYVSGKWYNLDNTWDENISNPSSPGGIRYDYFLKGSSDFDAHQRDAEFDTEEFNKNYPMSKTSYRVGFSDSNSNVIIIRKSEDVNSDGAIDAADLAEVAKRYNVTEESSNWDSRYDLNDDYIIDLYDMVKISSQL